MTAGGLQSGLFAVFGRVGGETVLACEDVPSGRAGDYRPITVGEAHAAALAAAIRRDHGDQGESVEAAPLTFAQAEAAALWRPPANAKPTRLGGYAVPGVGAWAYGLVAFDGAPWLTRGSLPESPSAGWYLTFTGEGRAGAERSCVLACREGGAGGRVFVCGFPTKQAAREFRWDSMPGGTLLSNFKDSARPVRAADFDAGRLPAVLARQDYALTWTHGGEEYCIIELI